MSGEKFLLDFNMFNNEIHLKEPMVINNWNLNAGKETLKVFSPEKINTIPIMKTNRGVEVKSLDTFTNDKIITNKKSEVLLIADNDIKDLQIKMYGWIDFSI